MYKNNIPIKDIAKHFGINKSTIYDRLNELNVDLRGRIDLIKYDRNFFENINSPIKAYFIGFIMGDGLIAKSPNYVVRIELHKKDIIILEKFAEEIKMDINNIKTSYGYPSQRVINIHSKKTVFDLINHGVPYNNKSYIAKPLKLDESLMQYFWLGLWDADGSISKIKHAPCSFEFELTGTKELCDGLSHFLGYDGKYVNKRTKTEAYRFRKSLSYLKDLNKIYNRLYGNAPFWLPRKRNKFESFIGMREIYEK